MGQETIPAAAVALQRLKDGNERFATGKPATKPADAEQRAALAKGQQPFAVVLACADSRVAPELVFDQGLGELLVLRVAGNVVDRSVLGSVEFAVEYLETPLIVVLGHESCGAVTAAVEGKPLPGELGWLVQQLHTGPSLPKDKKEAVAAGVRANALYQTAELSRRSQKVKELVQGQRVQVLTGIYSLETGRVDWIEAFEQK